MSILIKNTNWKGISMDFTGDKPSTIIMFVMNSFILDDELRQKKTHPKAGPIRSG
jgi:hypothetical protein